MAEEAKEVEKMIQGMPRMGRARSVYQFNAPIQKRSHLPWSKAILGGLDLIRNPHFNKGLGFTWEERRDLHLHGLLPPCYRNLDMQAKQVMHNINRMEDPLQKYQYFMSILDSQEKLFYKTLIENLRTLMPIVYTPTVGLACQKFGYIFTNPRGIWLSIKDRGRVLQMLKNYPYDSIKAICFTDGERILGLGDLGAYGMGIPIGKLALYTGCAGIRPNELLPIMLDCGTNRTELRESDFYVGIREGREDYIKNGDYDKFVDEVMRAICARWGPTTLIQFEDFGNRNAFRLLEKYKDDYCTFNDDIQGTASVALAGIYAALRVKGSRITKLNAHTFVMLGAGSAGIGISNLIADAIVHESGKTIEEARKQIWLVDSRGLVFKGRKSGGISSLKEPYAHEWKKGEIKKLDEIIEAVHGTALIGVSGQPQTFTRSVCKSLMAYNNRPIIMPMSNPTSKAECTAAQAYEWTENKCIFASGSPFPSMKVELDGKTIEIVPAQGNNAYIFPGVALGVIAAKASRVPNDMFLISARVLNSLVTHEMLEKGTVFPGLENIRQCSEAIAIAVAKALFSRGLATQVEPKDGDFESLIRRIQYDHTFQRYFVDSCFDDLEKTFGDRGGPAAAASN